MTDNLLVSICCTTFNHAPYIRQCLDGFMMQQCDFRFEVVIHDDASTDDTAKIVMEYENKYPDQIRGIYQTENQWSKGIRPSPTYVWPNAKGKYIALCEGDDYWIDLSKLQKQVSFLEQNENYSSSFSEVNLVDENSTFIQLSDRVPQDVTTLQYPDLIIQNTIHTCSFVFRRSSLDANLYAILQKMKVGDVPLFLYCSLNGPIHYFRNAMAAYRTNVGIMRANFDSESILTTKIEIIRYFKENVNRNRELKKFEFYGLMVNYHKLLRLRVKGKEYGKAFIVYVNLMCAYLGFLVNKSKFKTYHLFDVKKLAFPFLKSQKLLSSSK